MLIQVPEYTYGINRQRKIAQFQEKIHRRQISAGVVGGFSQSSGMEDPARRPEQVSKGKSYRQFTSHF